MKVELTIRGRSLAEAKIQRGIFPGDALSPLKFIIVMMPFQSHNEHGWYQTIYKKWKRAGNSNTRS